MANTNPSFSDLRQRKVSTLRFIISLIAALSIVLAVFRLQPDWFSPNSNVVPTSVAGVAITPTPTFTPKLTSSHYPYLGQGITIGNITILPLTMRYTYGSSANQPNVGNEFAVVMLRLVNHQDKDYDVIPNVPCPLVTCNFYLRDSEGRKNPPLSYDPFRTQLRPVILQPSSAIEGSYTFEVPRYDAEHNSLQLLYYDNPLLNADSVTHWQLKVLPSTHH